MMINNHIKYTLDQFEKGVWITRCHCNYSPTTGTSLKLPYNLSNENGG